MSSKFLVDVVERYLHLRVYQSRLNAQSIMLKIVAYVWESGYFEKNIEFSTVVEKKLLKIIRLLFWEFYCLYMYRYDQFLHPSHMTFK